jgi:streptomycin 6-kinase
VTGLPKAQLEAPARRLAAVWKIKLDEELPAGHCSRVWAGRDESGAEVALKMPHPNSEEARAGPVALAFAGHGGVPVLRHDAVSGALLMPRLRPAPGSATLDLAAAGLTDAQAAQHCGELILQLRKAPPIRAQTLAEWYRGFPADDPRPLVQEAAAALPRLLASAPPPTLLHGDLHHFNILADGGRWRAIDPKGLLGDPAFEVAAFMRNPLPATPEADLLHARLRLFAEILDDPIERLWGWSSVETVFCSLDTDGSGDDPWWVTAGRLAELGRSQGYRNALAG